MNYKKLALVGCISAFVAILTSVMGVAGTIIGSVISSVLYNMLTEIFEKPIGNKTFSSNFEWEIAYVFPIVVIAIIQLILIAALLSELGIFPYEFVNVYLLIQDVANNNLYRILGFALLVMSVYPFVLKRGIIKKSNGTVIAFVGLIFLARGFVDWGNAITNLYGTIFRYFDLPIAIIAFVLLVGVIYNILISAKEYESGPIVINSKDNKEDFSPKVRKVHRSTIYDDFEFVEKRTHKRKTPKHANHNRNYDKSQVTFKKDVNQDAGINQSSGNIQFESNDLLDEYK